MALFIFLMEYEGGTYISQVQAKSVRVACLKWANDLEVSEIENFEEADKDFLINDVKDEKPAKTFGVKNVWCLSLLPQNEKLALVNIILTEKKTDNEQITINN